MPNLLLQVPRARSKGLIVRDFGNETLIYDLERHKAHCLNQVAGIVWKHCDGKLSVADLALLLQDRSPASDKEEVVWVALEQLVEAKLLEGPLERPGKSSSLQRRQMLKKLGRAAAVAVPIVTSITSPTRAWLGSPPPHPEVPPGPGAPGGPGRGRR